MLAASVCFFQIIITKITGSQKMTTAALLERKLGEVPTVLMSLGASYTYINV